MSLIFLLKYTHGPKRCVIYNGRQH